MSGTLPARRSAQLAADPRPVVTPTRRAIDRRFRSLGFTITSAAPWVEVVLTTDPVLLEASAAPGRTAANFYASREHGGLTSTNAGRARYVVPTGIVDRLSGSGSVLWYVAVAYPDSTGGSGVASATQGASGRIQVDASMRNGRRTSAVAASLAAGPHTRASAQRAAGRSLDADDRLEGEDGADLPRSALMLSAGGRSLSDDTAYDRVAGEDGADLPQAPVPPPPMSPLDPASPGAAPEPAAQPMPPAAPAWEPPSDVPSSQPRAEMTALDYDDGWDALDRATIPALSDENGDGHDGDDGDEYPDIDWGELSSDYGPTPGYRSLEGATAESGPAEPPAVRPASGQRLTTVPQITLAAEVQRRIIELTLGSDDAAYAVINSDGAFRGRHGPGHKAFQRFHTGLSFGIAEFNQDSGTLGQLLLLMREREPENFAAVFGEASAELVVTTTAPGPSSEHAPGGRGPRVQPVAGADLWEEPWTGRFKASAAVPAFRAAQNQLAAGLFLAPMLPVAAGFGLTSERALCMVLDRAVVLGEYGAKRWVADTVGPMRTPALRRDGLAALGFDSIEAFQGSVAGLLVDGEFGPVTHSALTAALRLVGVSPIPLPDLSTAVALMAQRGATEDGSARLSRLASADGLGDAVLDS